LFRMRTQASTNVDKLLRKFQMAFGRRTALIVGLVLSPPVAVILYSIVQSFQVVSEKSTSGAAPQLKWDRLKTFNVEQDYAPPELKAMDGQDVRIPGYVVPLEDDDTTLTQFLLVPNPQACIHVPPPPPNQMVLVKINPSHAPKRSWGAVWIEGRLQIATSDTQYGKIAFRLYGDSAEVFKE